MRKSRIEVEGDVHLAKVNKRVADSGHGLEGLACVSDRPNRGQASHQYAQYVEHHFLRTRIRQVLNVSKETFKNIVCMSKYVCILDAVRTRVMCYCICN